MERKLLLRHIVEVHTKFAGGMLKFPTFVSIRVLWHPKCQVKISAEEQQRNFVLTTVWSAVAPVYSALQAYVIIHLFSLQNQMSSILPTSLFTPTPQKHL